MAKNLTAYTNYTSGVDIAVGLVSRDLGPNGRDVFSGLDLASAITTAAPAPWNGLTFHWDTSNLASQKLYVTGIPSSVTPAAGNWRELQIQTAGGETATFKFRLRVTRDAGDGNAYETVHGWDEFNHVSVRTKGDSAKFDAGLSMVGAKLAMSMNGLNGSANINGLSLGLNITGSNFSISYTSAVDVRFNYGPLLEITSTHYPSGISPEFESKNVPRKDGKPLAGESIFQTPLLRVGRRITKTKLPPIQLTFNQAHNFMGTGGDKEINTSLYLPERKDFQSFLGLGNGDVLGRAGGFGMLSPDEAYGEPPEILTELGSVYTTLMGENVKFPRGDNTGVEKSTDFISPIAKPVNLDTYAKTGGTCSFLFSAGASQTFQFRSTMMRVFTFGAGTSHHFSAIKDVYHQLHSVMAEKDLLLVKSHATYHYQCLPPLKENLIDQKNKVFKTARKEMHEKAMVSYRYEGKMRMSHVKLEDDGDERIVKDVSAIEMDEDSIRMLAPAFGFYYHSGAMKPGKIDPDDADAGSLVIGGNGVALQGDGVLLKTEGAKIFMNKNSVDITADIFAFNGKVIRVG